MRLLRCAELGERVGVQRGLAVAREHDAVAAVDGAAHLLGEI